MNIEKLKMKKILFEDFLQLFDKQFDFEFLTNICERFDIKWFLFAHTNTEDINNKNIESKKDELFKSKINYPFPLVVYIINPNDKFCLEFICIDKPIKDFMILINKVLKYRVIY